MCILIYLEGAQNTHIRKKIEHGLEIGKQKEPIEKLEEIKINEEIQQEQEIKSIEIGPKHLHHWKHQGLFKKEEEIKIEEGLKKIEEIKPTVIGPIHEYLSKLKGPIGKEEEIKEDEGIKKHGRHVLPREAPEEPAPVEEKMADDVNVNAGLPFLKPPPKPVYITLEREVVEKPKGTVLNTDIVSSLITIENNVEQSKERELPRRQAQEINSLSDIYITPRPIPAGPRPPTTIVPPENNVRTQVTVSPMSLGSVPVFARPAQGTFSSVSPVPIFQPTVTMGPVPPVPPPSPPPSPAPKPETPIITPRRYVAYLGDMFLKLMTQLLGRARLTLNRLTGPPSTSPEIANNA